jgi:hypothetical protein
MKSHAAIASNGFKNDKVDTVASEKPSSIVNQRHNSELYLKLPSLHIVHIISLFTPYFQNRIVLQRRLRLTLLLSCRHQPLRALSHHTLLPLRLDQSLLFTQRQRIWNSQQQHA